MTHVKFNNRNYDRSFNNIVDELFNGLPVLFNDGYSSLTKQGHVPVNIKETGDSYHVEVVAPGFDKAVETIASADILTFSCRFWSFLAGPGESPFAHE